MMTDNILKTRTLIDRFFDGDTTLIEEQQLYDFFRQAATLPDDLEALRPLFIDIAALPEAYAEPLPAAAHRPTSRRPWLRWAAAAAVAVLLLGGAAMLFHRSQPAVSIDDGEELVAYIYGRRTTDPAVVLGEMQTTMATLQGDGADVVEQQLKAMFDN